MTIQNLKNKITVIFNAIKINKPYVIVPYIKTLHTVINLLNIHYIKKIHYIGVFMLIEFNYYNLKSVLKIKFFNIKDRKNYYKFNSLKKISSIKGIILTPKGFCSILKALELKEGGILFCMFN